MFEETTSFIDAIITPEPRDPLRETMRWRRTLVANPFLMPVSMIALTETCTHYIFPDSVLYVILYPRNNRLKIHETVVAIYIHTSQVVVRELQQGGRVYKSMRQ